MNNYKAKTIQEYSMVFNLYSEENVLYVLTYFTINNKL